MKLMSLGFLVERDAPAIWRGPIIMKIVTQFLRDVNWGELDYFIVDLPPGTGDAQLSLVQATQVAGAIIVTTPQEVAVGDALRGAKMFERVGVPVIGVVENMSAFVDPETGRRFELFSSGGGQRLAEEIGVPLLGSVPLQPRLAELADAGQPILDREPRQPRRRQPARYRRAAPAEDGRPRRGPVRSCATDRPSETQGPSRASAVNDPVAPSSESGGGPAGPLRRAAGRRPGARAAARRPASSMVRSARRFSASPCPPSARRSSRCSSTSPTRSGSAARSAPMRSPRSRSPATPSGSSSRSASWSASASRPSPRGGTARADPPSAARAAGTALVMALVLGVMIAVGGVLSLPAIFRLMDAQGDGGGARARLPGRPARWAPS